jgi:hypothetical protein
MDRRAWAGGVVACAAMLLAACAANRWSLVRPPEVDDPTHPKGVPVEHCGALHDTRELGAKRVERAEPD